LALRRFVLLTGKRTLLGITGGIAAYKIPDLIRRIRSQNGEVRCIVTQAGREFVWEQVLQTLSGYPPLTALFSKEFLVEHIELSRWAHCLVIAPATANTLAKMAQGIADNLLTTTYLSFAGPVLAAPAMNTVMWEHPAVRANMELLRARNVSVVEPCEGALACGEQGKGRMAEPEAIFEWIVRSHTKPFLAGKNVLITAGPTREHIDPVRFISNSSSGKMGFALARAAWRAGAHVTLVAGPAGEKTPEGIERIDVVSAHEMFEAVQSRFSACNIFIANAAVADFAPRDPQQHKAPKSTLGESIPVRRTPDILAWAGGNKGARRIVGFALETRDAEASALEKMRQKHCDFLALNNPFQTSGGIGTDRNAVTLYGPQGKIRDLEDQPKLQLAAKILSILFE